MAGQAVGCLVHLAGADDDELLELGGDGARVEHGAEVCLHGGEDLGPVRHDAEHVGHVAALGKSLVEKSGQIRSDFGCDRDGKYGTSRLLEGLFYGIASGVTCSVAAIGQS